MDGGEKLNVLEVGAGTGIFTRALLAHPEWKDDVGELRVSTGDTGVGVRGAFRWHAAFTINPTSLQRSQKFRILTSLPGN